MNRREKRRQRYAAANPPSPEARYFLDPVERLLMGIEPAAPKAKPAEPPVVWPTAHRTLVDRFQLQRCENCGHECHPYVGRFARTSTPTDDGTTTSYILARDAGSAVVEVMEGVTLVPKCPLC